MEKRIRKPPITHCSHCLAAGQLDSNGPESLVASMPSYTFESSKSLVHRTLSTLMVGRAMSRCSKVAIVPRNSLLSVFLLIYSFVHRIVTVFNHPPLLLAAFVQPPCDLVLSFRS